MTVATIEGMAVAEIGDEVQPVLAGTRLRVPMDGNLRPFQRLVNPPEPYELRNLSGIPTRLLQRNIEIAQPLTREQVNGAMQRLLSGQPVCDGDGLPNCDQVPRTLLARAMKASRTNMENQLGCVFRRDSDEALADGETRPFCDEQPPETLPCVFVPGPDDAELSADESRPFCPQLPEDTTFRSLRNDLQEAPRPRLGANLIPEQRPGLTNVEIIAPPEENREQPSRDGDNNNDRTGSSRTINNPRPTATHPPRTPVPPDDPPPSGREGDNIEPTPPRATGG
jgi:hypothetical protein